MTCYKCVKRQIGCHSTCETYADFKQHQVQKKNNEIIAYSAERNVKRQSIIRRMGMKVYS